MLPLINKIKVAIDNKPWLILIFFIIVVLSIRWSTFYQSVIDWDESLYLLVANAWSEGNLPYTEVWDNKPPGIYSLFLLAITFLNDSVFSIRILTVLLFQ